MNMKTIWLSCTCFFFCVRLFFFVFLSTCFCLFVRGHVSVANDNNAWVHLGFIYTSVCISDDVSVCVREIYYKSHTIHDSMTFFVFFLPFCLFSYEDDACVKVFFWFFFFLFFTRARENRVISSLFFTAFKSGVGRWGTRNQKKGENEGTRDNRIKQWRMGRQVWQKHGRTNVNVNVRWLEGQRQTGKRGKQARQALDCWGRKKKKKETEKVINALKA